jgi:hypothetical protein
MDSFLGFAGIGTAIIASMGLAMWMEWYCLRWLMRVMPGQAGVGQRSTAVFHMAKEVEFAVNEPEPGGSELVAAAPGEATRQEISLGI